MVITTFDNKMKTLQMLNKVKGLHFFGKMPFYFSAGGYSLDW